MAQKRSDDSRYESRYGGGFVSSAQFIAEVICERLAKKDKKDLPVKFWNLPTWKRNFMTQVLAANSALKLYSPKAILAALRRERNVYSLRAPWFIPVMEEEQLKINNTLEKIEIDTTPSSSGVPVKVDEKPRTSFAQEKSTLSKLRGLD